MTGAVTPAINKLPGSQVAASALVLFDIDGTLLRRSGQHHKQALVEGIRQVAGVAVSFDNLPTAGMLDCDCCICCSEALAWSRTPSMLLCRT